MVVSIAVGAVCCLAAVRQLLAPDLAIDALYLIPVALVTWVAGVGSGRWLTLLSVGTSVIADLNGHAQWSRPAVIWVNCAIQLLLCSASTEVLAALARALDRERGLARVDPLTGLVNRREFEDVAQAEFVRSHRYGRRFTIVYIDLDNFKWVNDNLGHAAGDRVLKMVGTVLKNSLRDTDCEARLGGDEFALLLSETDLTNGLLTMNRVQRHLLSSMEDENWPITFSIGLVSFIHPPSSLADVLCAADSLMYQVKHSSKNGIKAALCDDMAEAMSAGGLRLPALER
ncbi:MAG: GGDEF domain-containing protein [Candidatus Xenobia bacterium]